MTDLEATKIHTLEPVAERFVGGRYALFDAIASGGMATVHYGRLIGPAGFSRTVAVKRLHAQFSNDPQFVRMLVDEARLASRVQHLNVVPVIDVIVEDGELFLVMDYIRGEALNVLIPASAQVLEAPCPLPIASSVTMGLLAGLEAAHNATSDHGEPLNIVHRDVSPHNVVVGDDGVARLLDFGVAFARERVQHTQTNGFKGKGAYASPEQLEQAPLDRRADVFAASIILWELLTGTRLFQGASLTETFMKAMACDVAAPSEHRPEISKELDAVVLRGLHRDRDLRYQSASDMAKDLAKALPPCPISQTAEWVQQIAGAALEMRAAQVQRIERVSSIKVGDLNLDDLSTPSATLPLIPQQDEPPPGKTKFLLMAAAAIAAIGLALTAWNLFNVSGITSAAVPTPVTSTSKQAPKDTGGNVPEGPTLTQSTEDTSATTPATNDVQAKPTGVSRTSSPQKPKAVRVRTKRPRRRPTRKAPPPAATPAAPDCDPPYTISPTGVRIPIAACL